VEAQKALADISFFLYTENKLMALSNYFTSLFTKKKNNSQQKARLWTILLIVLPFLLGLALYSLTQVKQVAAEWWNETWLYRRGILISNSNGTDLENFQISFELDTASLISANKMQSACEDLRVTDWDGNLLAHWIEEDNPGCNNANTKVWVKVPTVYKGNNASTIFIYYGNSTASNTENGSNVFEFFEDFTEYSDWIGETENFALDTDGSRQVLGVSGNNGPGEIYKEASLESSYIVEMAIRATSTATNSPHPGLIFASNGTNADYYGMYLRASTNQIVETHDGAFGSFTNSQTIDSNWHVYKAVVNAGFLEALYFDSTRQTAFDNWDITNSYSHIGIWSHSAGTAYYDNLFVRQYASTDPTTSLSSSEESSPAPVGYWKFDEESGSTAYDSSGQENHGTVATATRETPDSCIDGQCLNFPGTVTVSDDELLNFNTKDFTISAWALHRDYTYPRSNFMIKKSIKCYADGVANAGFDIGHGYKSTGIDICIRDISNNFVRSTLSFNNGSQPSDLINQWVHYNFVFDRSNGKVLAYINGKKQSNELNISTVTDSIDNAQSLIIGTMYGWWTDGLMDEIKIYPYARSAEQINADYIAGSAKIGSKTVFGHQMGSAAITPLPSKLLAYWKFDGASGSTAYDSSDQENHGTITSATWTKQGKKGSALSFDGTTSNYVSVPAITSLTSGAPFTISVWVKPENTGNYRAILGYSGTRRLLIGSSGAMLSQQDGNFWSNGTGDVPNGSWTHVIYWFNGTEERWYINGKQSGASHSTTSPSWNQAFRIGQYDLVNYPYKGLIDEVKIYDSALSAGEILQEYNQGVSTVMGQSPESPAGSAGSSASEYCVPGDTGSCSPPVGEWTFDENTGTVAHDYSDNSNDGTLVDMSNSNWIKGVNSLGSALNFDGNNYVQAGSNTILGSSAFTLQGWFKAGSHSTFGLGVSIGNASTSQAAWLGWCSSASLGTSNSIGGGFYGRNYGSGITDNDWHFLTLTFSGGTSGTASLYVDGKLKVTDTYTPNLQATAVMFGKANTGTSFWYSGSIDNVRIYDYARTPAQVAWDYNRGAPVAHWRLDECQGTTANDISGNNNHGTINIGSSGTQNALGSCRSGSSTEAWYNGRNGQFNSSLSFDGTDDYIDLGNDSSIKDFTNQISVSAWAKYNAYGGGGQSYSVIAVKGSPWTFLMENPSNKIRFRLTVGGLDRNAADSETHELNRWYHFVGTYDGANIKIYKDGTLVGTTPITGNLAVNDVSAKIGTYQGTNYNFNGQIDDVRIYNYALTLEQIKLLYNDNAAIRF